MTLRFSWQCRAAHRLKHVGVSDPDPVWRRAFAELRARLGVTRPVRLLVSGLAEVPMVVGWFSPVVLVPAAAFTGLGPDQLKSLLAHELAHVRRRDHLLNAVQAVVEIVLFFHPAVWWISKQVRLEREYCCDDSSVRATGDPTFLAEALAAMETLRIQKPSASTVLATHGGPLMERITRILGVRPEGRTRATGWRLPAGLALAGIVAATGGAYAAPGSSSEAPAVQEESAQKAVKKARKARQARDLKSLEEKVARIKAALEAGEMKKEEAARAMRVIEMQEHHAHELRRVEEALAAGTMTKEEAKKVLAGLRDRLHERALEGERAHDRKKREADVDAVKHRLAKAVEEGKITREQASERMKEYLRHLELESRKWRVEHDAEAVAKEIQSTVEAGELTPDEGRKKLEELRRAIESRRSPEETVRRIQADVEAGRITPAQGKEKLEALKKARPERSDFAAVQEKLEAAVRAGKLTPQQAKERLKAHEKELDLVKAAKKRAELELVEVQRRIRAAVEAGEITAEQGRERLESLRRKKAERKAKAK